MSKLTIWLIVLSYSILCAYVVTISVVFFFFLRSLFLCFLSFLVLKCGSLLHTPPYKLCFLLPFSMIPTVLLSLHATSFLPVPFPLFPTIFHWSLGSLNPGLHRLLPTSTSPQLSFSVHLLESPGSVSTLRRAAPRSAHGCRKGLAPLTALSKAPGCQLSVSPQWVVVKAGSHLLELTLPFCLLKDYHLLACGGDIVLWRA